MATVYILYSKSGDHFYIGSCKEVEIRLKEHIGKLFPTSFTAKFDDWELFLTINDLEYEQARDIANHKKK